VPVPCVERVPDGPASIWVALPADAALYDQVRALLLDRLATESYVAELRGLLTGCSGQQE
jgi:hypothetical protein